MHRTFSWLMVAATILLTSYGQLVLKWQVTTKAAPPFAFMLSWPPLLQMLARPWVISAFVAAFAASLCWMLALSRLELNRAYPFMALNFVIVCMAAIPLFGESMNPSKLIGLVLIILGLAAISQG